MSFIPKPQEIYKHFKGDLYQVTAIAQHTETGEQLVVYQALYGDFKIYARPLPMFAGRVDRKKYPDVVQEFCFELQGPDADRQKRESGSRESVTVPEDVGEVREMPGPSDRPGDVEAVPEEGRVAGEAETEPSGEICGNDEEVSLDPMVLEFLDTDSYEQRLNILAGLHHRITDEMITVMAIACDIEINDGDVEERYEALKYCLMTLERYECNRLR